MAYNIYVACDRCGEDPFEWKNQNISMRRAKKLVKEAGWYVTGDGRWYCEECGETIRKAERIVFGEIME